MWKNIINNLSPVENSLEGKLPEWLIEELNNKNFFYQSSRLFPLQPIKILGTCSSDLYLDCPNIPEWHIDNSENLSDSYYLKNIGFYYWFDFDIIGSDTKKIELRMVFNDGDADCNDGFWGAVWERNTEKLIANIMSTGDCETTIEVIYSNNYQPHNIEIPSTRWCMVYANNLELEKLIGLAINICRERDSKYSEVMNN